MINPTESILVTSSYVNVPPILTLPEAVIVPTVISGDPVKLEARDAVPIDLP